MKFSNWCLNKRAVDDVNARITMSRYEYDAQLGTQKEALFFDKTARLLRNRRIRDRLQNSQNDRIVVFFCVISLPHFSFDFLVDAKKKGKKKKEKMLPVDRSDSDMYAERYSNLKITGTQYLAFRDVPRLIDEYVSGTRTLDYGCGVGKSSCFLKSFGLRVKGVDINAAMIKKAKILDANGEYEAIESGKIPADDEQYDFVFSSYVLVEVSSKEELMKIVREIARVLRPGGTFITVVCNEDTYNTDWISENTEFEENRNLRSGSIVRILFKEINLNLYDYFWSDEDYREVIQQAGLNLKRIHKPLGTDDDGYEWVNEKIKSPCTIYVAKKP